MIEVVAQGFPQGHDDPGPEGYAQELVPGEPPTQELLKGPFEEIGKAQTVKDHCPQKTQAFYKGAFQGLGIVSDTQKDQKDYSGKIFLPGLHKGSITRWVLVG